MSASRTSHPPSSLGNIKGAVLREFALWYEEKLGRDRIGRAIRRLDEQYPGTFDAGREAYGILASSWYPGELVHALLDELTVGYSEGDLAALAEDAARVIMGRTLRGVYKTLFRMVASPERFRKYGHSLWSQHYDTGRNETVELAPRTHRTQYLEWKSHHPFICRMNMASSVPIYEAMGCLGVTYERKTCVSSGAAVCENLIRWRG